MNSKKISKLLKLQKLYLKTLKMFIEKLRLFTPTISTGSVCLHRHKLLFFEAI